MTQPRVLLVAPDGGVVRSGAGLRAAGLSDKLVNEFAAAKDALTTRPDLLITELKLGAYNGLHLAIRASVQGTPAIVVGEPDPVLEAEAERQHATYLRSQSRRARSGRCQRTPDGRTALRRSPRKQVPLLDAFANEVPARVLDVSYEGLRLEAPEAGSEHLPAYSRFASHCSTSPASAARLDGADDAEQGGVSERYLVRRGIAMGDAETALTWRALVDSMPVWPSPLDGNFEVRTQELRRTLPRRRCSNCEGHCHVFGAAFPFSVLLSSHFSIRTPFAGLGTAETGDGTGISAAPP